MYALRDYQIRAVEAGRRALTAGRNGILVLPTGSGKSLVIASLLLDLPGNSLVLQPTKEILEQNLGKAQAFGFTDLGVWSASCGRKDLGKVTFAMVGSIMRHREAFHCFDRIVVDEAHRVDSKGGMYESLIRGLGVPVVGCTATPWRMRSYMNQTTGEPVAESHILTRTRPRIFDAISHVTPIQDLAAGGFWCPLAYEANPDYDSSEIAANSTGQDFDEDALRSYHEAKRVVRKVVDAVLGVPAKHVLVFTRFREESAQVIELLTAAGVACEEVSAETTKRDRERLIGGFRSGAIRCVVNVGVLTTGFDFPDLDCVILGRPTKSVALYYQMTGRGVRPAPGKPTCRLIDLCGNVKQFGRVESFRLIDQTGRGLWELRSEKGLLTGVNLSPTSGSRATDHGPAQTVDPNLVVSFGKFEGKTLSNLPAWYLKWGSEKLHGKWLGVFQAEMQRRKSGGW